MLHFFFRDFERIKLIFVFTECFSSVISIYWFGIDHSNIPILRWQIIEIYSRKIRPRIHTFLSFSQREAECIFQTKNVYVLL